MELTELEESMELMYGANRTRRKYGANVWS